MQVQRLAHSLIFARTLRTQWIEANIGRVHDESDEVSGSPRVLVTFARTGRSSPA